MSLEERENLVDQFVKDNPKKPLLQMREELIYNLVKNYAGISEYGVYTPIKNKGIASKDTIISDIAHMVKISKKLTQKKDNRRNNITHHLYINNENESIIIQERINRMIEYTEEFKNAVSDFKLKHQSKGKPFNIYFMDLIRFIQLWYYGAITGIAYSIERGIKLLEDRKILYTYFVQLLSKSNDLNQILQPFLTQALEDSANKLNKLYDKDIENTPYADVFRSLFKLYRKLLTEPTA